MAGKNKPGDTPSQREDAVTAREETATHREDAADAREQGAGRRENTATEREGAAGLREGAAALREETSTLREEAVRAREDAAQAESELQGLMTQMREANARLIVSTVRAHTMTEDAEQANHLKDEFLATVSHELRTPLNAVLGWARMLGSDQLPPGRAKHAVEIIERNAAILAQLIDELLDVSRIVSGTLRWSRQPVELVALVQSVVETVESLATAKQVRITFSPPPGETAVAGDPGRLRQVVTNLIANAIKFNSEGGRVEIFVERSDGYVEVKVVDTGQGISPEFLPHVFERFRQADAETGLRHAGLGLGLAIVRQLVELHGGTVNAASEGLGRGATFTIRLPVTAREAHPLQAAALPDRRTFSPSAARVTPLDNLRILVVDDSDDSRALTSLMLTQAGASVSGVASVGEALLILEDEEERPDVLVSDIGLANEDGFGLIRRLRRSEAEHGGFVPAVAVTGYVRAEDRARILSAGFQAHVPKPVEQVELTAAIASLLHDSGDDEA